MPQTMIEEVDSLFESMDVLGEFIDSECELHPGHRVESGVLWQAYRAWCEVNGRTPAFKDARPFARNLAARDGIEARRTKACRYLSGIGLAATARPALGNDVDDVDDVKTAFSEKCFSTALMREFSEKPVLTSSTSSPNVKDAALESCGTETETSCPHCGGKEWYLQPLAFDGRGGLVCAGCSRARPVHNEPGAERENDVPEDYEPGSEG